MSSALAIGFRGWCRYRRIPQTMALPVAQAVAFLLIFRYVFGGAIQTGGRYVDFMVPGLITVSAMFAAMGTGIGGPTTSAMDCTTGFGRCPRRVRRSSSDAPWPTPAWSRSSSP